MTETRTDVQPAREPAEGPDAAATLERLRTAVEHGFPSTVADLTRLVRIPSVSWSAFDPDHVARSAEAVA